MATGLERDGPTQCWWGSATDLQPNLAMKVPDPCQIRSPTLDCSSQILRMTSGFVMMSRDKIIQIKIIQLALLDGAILGFQGDGL